MSKVFFVFVQIFCVSFSSLSYAGKSAVNLFPPVNPQVRAALQAAVASEAASPVPNYECPPWPPCHFENYFVGQEYPVECSYSENAQYLEEAVYFLQIARVSVIGGLCYTADPRSTVNMNAGVMPANSVIAWLQANNAPEKFQQAAQLIVFTQSADYQAITISLTPSSGVIREVVGVANNVNGTVTIAFIDATISATLMPKQQAYSATEEANVIQTLRAIVYDSMLQQLGTQQALSKDILPPPLPKSSAPKIVYAQQASSLKGSSGGLMSYLAGSMTSYWSIVPDLIKVFSSSSWQVVEEVKALGFENLKDSAQGLKMLGVEVGKGAQVLSVAAQLGFLPTNNQNLLSLLEEELGLASNDTWVKAVTTWSDNGSLSYTAIYKSSNPLTQKEDWLFFTYSGSFVLAPDTLIVITGQSILGGLWSSETIQYQQVPHIVTTNDIMAISLLFDITAAGIISGILSIPYVFPTLP